MNQLFNASSPYLQQHANNPVHWHEWNEETLQKAKDKNKPLLISIGYAACHWCHVMARETFMNEEAAKVMNAHFICIKIDREERPDIDQVYMEAVQAIKGTGGWPLNAFALPNGQPFYAGTYYPTQHWKSLLQQIHQLHENEHLKLVDEALQLSNNIQKQQLLPLVKTEEKSELKELYLQLFAAWRGRIDLLRGGFGTAPKFPLPVGWNFLLEYYQQTNNSEVLKAVNNSLTAMANGGIYDQIGGGFARYSVDSYWRVPHFEKMLYDNGQLISLYSNAYLVDKNLLYKKVISQTLDFVEDLLMDKNGGFYASLNADSEGEEGTFYIFTQEEIEKNFDVDIAKFIIDYYHFTEEGNWEHRKNTLFTTYSPASYAQKTGISTKEVYILLQKATDELFNYRQKRIHPTTDTKILTAWNALMLQGFLDAFIALENPKYLAIALKNAYFLGNNLLKDDFSLYRNFKDGKASITGFLEDYAFLADAFLKLYQVTFNTHWLEISKNLIDYCITHFYDSTDEVFAFTSNLEKSLYVKKYEVFDNVTPSSNAVMANVLYRLGLLFDHQPYISIGEKLLKRMMPQLKNSGPYTAKWASLLGFMVSGAPTLAVIGPKSLAMALEIQRKSTSSILICGGIKENIPYLKDKLIEGKTSIYLCKNNSCSAPIFTIEEVLERI
ncbi:MAG: thioredoxin domain-containing protein [Flavobacteriaceae bacterium]|nr:thioredoxin domain-containing protein [Flavobacteriaceae bacterium]